MNAPFETVPFLDALRNRRSRRFCAGMEMPAGPLAFKSSKPPQPLTEEEEACLAFAACGITGHALSDLAHGKGQGGTIMAGRVGRTIASGDGIQTVGLVVTNDRGTWYYRRPQECTPAEIQELIDLGREGRFLEWSRLIRKQIKPHRLNPPNEPLYNINANRWSAYAPGTTYFLPVNELTWMYVNGLLEILNEFTGAYILDDRAGFRPAGLAAFARNNGGHLEDDPTKNRVATITIVERMVTEFVTLEQGFMLQNVMLACEALGLAGFPNFANHDFGWFQALGSCADQVPLTDYLCMRGITRFGAKLLNRDTPVPWATGIPAEGQTFLKPLQPDANGSMRHAVETVIAHKFGPTGIFKIPHPSWTNAREKIPQIPETSVVAKEAAIAYCDYIARAYGRFPGTMPALRTVVGFQAGRLDQDFYTQHFKP